MSRPPSAPPTRWIVTERMQPGEEGVRWVQLSFAREVAWAASEPRRDEERAGEGAGAQGSSAA